MLHLQNCLAGDERCKGVTMRTYILGCLALLGACSPQYTETRLAPGTPPPINEAVFSDRPDTLHAAFRDSCRGPSETYTALSRDSARCRMIPPPDVAAGLVLRYDGALEVPHIVIERKTRRVDEGYVVGIEYFATVPQRSGADQRVYLRSDSLDRTISNLFRAFGGTPI